MPKEARSAWIPRARRTDWGASRERRRESDVLRLSVPGGPGPKSTHAIGVAADVRAPSAIQSCEEADPLDFTSRASAVTGSASGAIGARNAQPHASRRTVGTRESRRGVGREQQDRARSPEQQHARAESDPLVAPVESARATGWSASTNATPVARIRSIHLLGPRSFVVLTFFLTILLSDRGVLEPDRTAGHQVHDQHRTPFDGRDVCGARRQDDPAFRLTVEARLAVERDAEVHLAVRVDVPGPGAGHPDGVDRLVAGLRACLRDAAPADGRAPAIGDATLGEQRPERRSEGARLDAARIEPTFELGARRDRIDEVESGRGIDQGSEGLDHGKRNF